MNLPQSIALTDSSFPVIDSVGAWVPHGKFVMDGALKGPLAGLTFAAKDLYDVKGRPTGAGNPTWLSTHPSAIQSSPLIEVLLAAGATLVGKTLTDELAYSIHGENMHYGTPRNVSAPGRIPGGSSSGSVAAVAARLCDFALASDTGGSTRVPASYCGVWGIRTTHDLLSRTNMVPLSPGFDTATWLGHDAETFMRVADVLLPCDATPPLTRAILFEESLMPASAECRTLAEKVFAVLSGQMEAHRASVTPSGNADELEIWRQTYLIASGREAWAAHGEWIEAHRPVFGAAIDTRWAFARTISAAAADAASVRQQKIKVHVRALLGASAVAVIPSAPGPAPLLTASAEEIEDMRNRTFRITCIAGLSGLPQVSLPLRSPEGLPIGISLLGPAGSDRALISLAIAVWKALHPIASQNHIQFG